MSGKWYIIVILFRLSYISNISYASKSMVYSTTFVTEIKAITKFVQ